MNGERAGKFNKYTQISAQKQKNIREDEKSIADVHFILQREAFKHRECIQKLLMNSVFN